MHVWRMAERSGGVNDDVQASIESAISFSATIISDVEYSCPRLFLIITKTTKNEAANYPSFFNHQWKKKSAAWFFYLLRF